MNNKSNIIIICLSLILLLTSCKKNYVNNQVDGEILFPENSEKLYDGTYIASFSHCNNEGWRPEISIKIINNIITEVKYNEVNNEGEVKANSNDYINLYKKEKKRNLLDVYQSYSSQLIKKQDIKLVDSITGATETYNYFYILARKSLLLAKEGKINKIIIPMSDNYIVETDYNQLGWKGVLKISILNNIINEVDYYELNLNNQLKEENIELNKKYYKLNDTTFKKVFDSLESQLLKNNCLKEVDIITGATISTNKFNDLVNKLVNIRTPHDNF